MADEDKEIDAMKAIAAAFEPLDEVTRDRVLQWASSRFRSQEVMRSEVFDQMPTTQRYAETSSGMAANSTAYDTFAELFDATSPSIERDKALVAAYWAQVCQGSPSFPAQTLNADLKDLGHGVGNITEALTQLKNERPALILQLKKSGTSKQARKTYKLTQEGIKRVHAMMRDGNSANELS